LAEDQPSLIKPCRRFSRTRLSDVLHREACALVQPAVVGTLKSPYLSYKSLGKPRCQFPWNLDGASPGCYGGGCNFKYSGNNRRHPRGFFSDNLRR